MKEVLDYVAGRGPAKHEVVERNQHVSGSYAQWYLDHPHIFKWAGAAAFSSHRVGVLLGLYDLQVEAGDITKATPVLHQLAGLFGMEEDVLHDLNLLRQTNNAVFDEIGPAHAAYIAPDGGLEAIEATFGKSPTHTRLLEGFREIDRGRQLLEKEAAAPEGTSHVWKGSLLIAEHEQAVTIQGQFDRMKSKFGSFLSAVTWMDFEMESRFIFGDILAARDSTGIFDWMERRPPTSSVTSFHRFILERGPHLLADRRAVPNFTDLRQRWFWVRKAVFPMWRQIEEADAIAPNPVLGERLRMVIDRPLDATRVFSLAPPPGVDT